MINPADSGVLINSPSLLLSQPLERALLQGWKSEDGIKGPRMFVFGPANDETSLHLDSFLNEKPSETRALLKVCEDNGFSVFTAILTHSIYENESYYKSFGRTDVDQFSSKAKEEWVINKVCDLEGNAMVQWIEAQEAQVIQRPTLAKFTNRLPAAKKVIKRKETPNLSTVTERYRDRVSLDMDFSWPR